jgi:hypothetical protein
MGSVTYRLLCLSPTLVLALPPQADAVQPSQGTHRQADSIGSGR